MDSNITVEVVRAFARVAIVLDLVSHSELHYLVDCEVAEMQPDQLHRIAELAERGIAALRSEAERRKPGHVAEIT